MQGCRKEGVKFLYHVTYKWPICLENGPLYLSVDEKESVQICTVSRPELTASYHCSKATDFHITLSWLTKSSDGFFGFLLFYHSQQASYVIRIRDHYVFCVIYVYFITGYFWTCDNSFPCHQGQMWPSREQWDGRVTYDPAGVFFQDTRSNLSPL